jgi:hypothetical protein
MKTGMMFAWRGGGTDDEPDVNTETFIRNINTGVQYSNKWNDDIHSTFRQIQQPGI